MARGKGRGGYRRPSSPAAASGPGALSQRTDGGPSPDFVGLGYGENKAVNEQASSAPMAGRGAGGGGGSPAPQQQRRPVPLGPEGVFGGTNRPGEPVTAGIDWGPGVGRTDAQLPDDPNLLLRAIVSKVGYHPDLVRLLARG